MTGKQAIALSGHSRSWLQKHSCAWCDRTLWRALLYGCGQYSIYEKCDPAKKNFGEDHRI